MEYMSDPDMSRMKSERINRKLKTKMKMPTGKEGNEHDVYNERSLYNP